MPVDDFETSFLKLFIGIQALLLLTVVMNLHKGIPLSLAILGLVAYAINLLTRNTPFGRHLYAIGGNEEAARLSGVPVARTIIVAYVILGAIVALTGFLQTAYGGYSTSTVGKLMELDAIAACVIGGTSMSGGIGIVPGVLVGALVMASLDNGMSLINLENFWQFIVKGLVLILAVWADTATKAKS